MSNESKQQLQEYLSQLLAVEEALKTATPDQKTDLLDLESKLQEVVSLLQGNQNESDNSSEEEEEPPPENTSSIDNEFARFQMEISVLDGRLEEERVQSDDSSSNDAIDKPNEELSAVLSSLEGNKCRAPYSYQWGEKGYHNAMIISADFDPQSLENGDDVEVSVMFCNPVCDKMKPCSFFLNGHCKFSDDRCRFSHGHKVNFSELQEFVIPDFSQLAVDSRCLVKGKDDLWQSATVEKCLEEQAYVVKYDRTGKTATIDVNDIMPLDYNHTLNSSDDETELDCLPIHPDKFGECGNSNGEFIVPGLPAAYSLSPSTWEQHTKGIGSKLMEKMGHVWGQGLGKNSDGRLEPVEAVILPAGKSLDKCIEMREKCNPKGPVAVETRLGSEQDKEEQRSKRIRVDEQRAQKQNVFDFINSKISKVSSENGHSSITEDGHNSNSHKTASSKSLNVQIFSIGEDIRRAKRELYRLKQSLVRNSERNEAVRSQVEKKIAAQNDVLRTLQAKEQRISESIKSQTNQKKLTIF